jgi:ubiquinone biosynthesis protein
MHTRPELVLLQKTMVVVEGVARRLDPNFDMWTTAEPIVAEWMERHLGVTGRLEEAAATVKQVGRFLDHLPDTLARVESAVDRLGAFTASGIKLDDDTVDRLAETGAKELWAVRLAALALIILAAIAVF